MSLSGIVQYDAGFDRVEYERDLKEYLAELEETYEPDEIEEMHQGADKEDLLYSLQALEICALSGLPVGVGPAIVLINAKTSEYRQVISGPWAVANLSEFQQHISEVTEGREWEYHWKDSADEDPVELTREQFFERLEKLAANGTG